MNTKEKVEAYYTQDHPFKKGIEILRELAIKVKAEETFKWQATVYMANGKNVFWIARFKDHFGVGFFNGALLSDPKNVLENVQEGKTVAMRHWKFTDVEAVDEAGVAAYMQEAIDNQKKGLNAPSEKKKKKTIIPRLLQDALRENKSLKVAFDALSPGKQRNFCDYISEAKQEKTKVSRLDKILPMIESGIGLNDKYRK